MNHVILGASAAGLHAAKTLRILDQDAAITVVSKDTNAYSRCMLHLYIAGERDLEHLAFVPEDFFAAHSIQWEKGGVAVHVDFDQKTVILENDKTLPYDRLLIATGSESIIPPIEGLRGARNVFKVRDIEDAEKIKRYAQTSKHAVIIGAGLIGLDVAAALLKQGLCVTLVEMGDSLLPRQLDVYAATKYQSLFEKAGAHFHLGTAVKSATGADHTISALQLDDGSELPCDFVVVAAGVRPQTAFIQDNRFKMDRGIVTDDQMRTSVTDVFAAGDVTGRSAIWPQAVKQGIVAAYNMAGEHRHLEDTFTEKNAMNLLGLQTISVGLVEAPDDSYRVLSLQNEQVYKKLIVKGNRLFGVLLQGDLKGAGFWTQLVSQKLPIRTDTNDLFEESYANYYQFDQKGQYVYSN